MALDATTATPPTPVSSADVSNANALNQAISAVRQQLGSNTAVIKQITQAIQSSVIGGTTGTSPLHVLLSKGTSGFALQPATSLTMDAVIGALQNSVGVAGGQNEYFRAAPTNVGTGKPYLAIKSDSFATGWQIVLFDGTSSAGQLTAVLNNFSLNTTLSQSATGRLQILGSDAHQMYLLPSNSSGGFNALVQNGDSTFVWDQNGGLDTGNLVFGPHSSLAGGAGFRMTADGISRFATETGTPEFALTDGATIAWNMQIAQSAYVQISGNRAMGTPSNPVPGFTYMLTVQQNAGGNTLSFPNPPFKWPNGAAPTLSAGASAIDVFSFYCHTTSFIAGTVLKNFS